MSEPVYEWVKDINCLWFLVSDRQNFLSSCTQKPMLFLLLLANHAHDTIGICVYVCAWFEVLRCCCLRDGLTQINYTVEFSIAWTLLFHTLMLNSPTQLTFWLNRWTDCNEFGFLHMYRMANNRLPLLRYLVHSTSNDNFTEKGFLSFNFSAILAHLLLTHTYSCTRSVQQKGDETKKKYHWKIHNGTTPSSLCNIQEIWYSDFQGFPQKETENAVVEMVYFIIPTNHQLCMCMRFRYRLFICRCMYVSNLSRQYSILYHMKCHIILSAVAHNKIYIL